MLTFTAAYALVWLALACYVGWLSSKQRRLRAQYDRLQQQFSAGQSPEDADEVSPRRVA